MSQPRHTTLVPRLLTAIAACVTSVMHGVAAGQDDPPIPPPKPAEISLQEAAEAPPEDPAAPGPRLRFCDEGAQTVSFGVSFADDFNDLTEFQVYGAYSLFLEPRAEFIVEASLRYFNQVGDNAVGINPMVVFRYHFWKSDEEATWTAYADLGIGFLLATSDVPEDGTSFNFTPRVGVGVTRSISEDWRLLFGVRWSHVSNARLWGDDDNPSSDAPMFHVSVFRQF